MHTFISTSFLERLALQFYYLYLFPFETPTPYINITSTQHTHRSGHRSDAGQGHITQVRSHMQRKAPSGQVPNWPRQARSSKPDLPRQAPADPQIIRLCRNGVCLRCGAPWQGPPGARQDLTGPRWPAGDS